MLLEDPEVDINDQTDQHKLTALMPAAQEGHLEVVKYLHARGADRQTQSLRLGAPSLLQPRRAARPDETGRAADRAAGAARRRAGTVALPVGRLRCFS